jgi:hypothetical protein
MVMPATLLWAYMMAKITLHIHTFGSNMTNCVVPGVFHGDGWVSSISRMLFEDEYSIKQPIVFEYQNSPF